MIRLLTTGGTFDKVYCPIKKKMILEESKIPEILKNANCRRIVRVEHIIKKFSNFFVDSDFKKIIRKCKKSRERSIVITHGTEKMSETAKLLVNAKINKTIVLVGAMIPYSIPENDASFNLGFAIGVVQTLPVGVYVAMNGKIFDGSKVVKNRVLGRFEAVK